MTAAPRNLVFLIQLAATGLMACGSSQRTVPLTGELLDGGFDAGSSCSEEPSCFPDAGVPDAGASDAGDDGGSVVPRCQSWSSPRGLPPNFDVRSWTPLETGGVLVAGGPVYFAADGGIYGDQRAFQYSPESDAYAEVGRMVAPQNGQGATFPDGHVIVVGGWIWVVDTWLGYNEVQEFDPSTGQWAELPRMHHPRGSPALVALDDRYLLVVGGEDDPYAPNTLRSVELYDRQAQTWTELAAAPGGISDSSGTLTARMPDGRAVMTGVETPGPYEGQTFRQIFDPVSRGWSRGSGIEDRGFDWVSAVLGDGTVVEAVGRGNAPTAIAQYRDDGWSRESLPASDAGLSSVARLSGDRLLVAQNVRDDSAMTGERTVFQTLDAISLKWSPVTGPDDDVVYRWMVEIGNDRVLVLGTDSQSRPRALIWSDCQRGK